MEAYPYYGGHGASWRRSTYRDVPVGVPEILLHTAGPRSTVNRNAQPSFSGMGTIEEGDLELYTPHNGTYGTGDPVFTLPTGEETIAHVEVTGNPIEEVVATPTQDNNWWILLAIAAGLYFMSKGE